MKTLLEQCKSWAERFQYGPPLAPVELEEMAAQLDLLTDLVDVMEAYHCETPKELEAYLEEQGCLSYSQGDFDEICQERDDLQRDLSAAEEEIEDLKTELAKYCEEVDA
jgi:hypothetical protein